MTASEKKPPVLSAEMVKLKLSIHHKIRKEEELLEAVHKKSRFADTISNGIANVIGFFATLPNTVAQLPIVGFAFKMFAIIPGAITTLTDSKKSITDKVIAMSILVAVVALSIASVGVTAAAAGAAATVVAAAAVQASIIGITLSALMTVMELIKLVTLSKEKYKARTALDDKKEFIKALANKAMPDGDKFDTQLEIRAVELEQKKSRPGFISEEQKEELKFVKNELEKKGIDIASAKDGSAFQLQDLYAKRDQKLREMADLIKEVPSAAEGDDLSKTFENMRALQGEIVTIDNDIEEITQPVEKVKRRNLVANENIAQCVTTLSMAVLGFITSVAGYFIAGVTAASIIGPILAGIGIGMASLSLVTGIAFKYAEHDDIKAAENKLENHKDNILDEALDCYEKIQATKSSVSSSAIIMGGLGSKANTEPALTRCAPEIVSQPDPIPVVPDKTIEPPVAVVEIQPEETLVNSSLSV